MPSKLRSAIGRIGRAINLASPFAAPSNNPTPPPPLGIIGKQTPSGRGEGQLTGNQAKWDVWATPYSFPGFQRAWTGIYKNYRLMTLHPTIALCRAATRAVMKSAEWTVEADEDAPDGALDMIQETIVRNRMRWMNDMYRAIDFGNQPFEKIWGYDPDHGTVITDLKPLLPDITTVSVDAGGKIVALCNGSATLGPEKFFYLLYDAEAGNYFGQSRLENIRTSGFRAWMETVERLGQYMTKIAGAMPIVSYPPGQVTDKDGNTKDSFDVAKSIIASIQSGLGVAAPKIYDADIAALIATNPEAAKALAWGIDMLEAKVDHAAAFNNVLERAETWCAQGYLWPARSILEGQFGTKAEAGAHQEIGIKIAEQDLGDIIVQVNAQLVDDMVFANYGPQAVGKVWISAASLDDDTISFMRTFVEGILGNASNADLALATLDFDAMIDKTGLPKNKTTVDPTSMVIPSIAGNLNPGNPPAMPPNQVNPVNPDKPDPAAKPNAATDMDRMATAQSNRAKGRRK